MFNDLRARLSDRRMTIEVTEEACRFIARQGFDPVYGARPLRRFIAREVETRIARALLGGNVPDASVIKVDAQQGEIVIENTPPAHAENTP
jgi:ATP-dependent Clp protease ATP-binding subunit ClpB